MGWQMLTGMLDSAQVRGLGEMAANFGVDTAPALLVVCNGDPTTADRYDGEFKSGPIRDFISKYAGGRKCASAVKVCMHYLCLPTHHPLSLTCINLLPGCKNWYAGLARASAIDTRGSCQLLLHSKSLTKQCLWPAGVSS